MSSAHRLTRLNWACLALLATVGGAAPVWADTPSETSLATLETYCQEQGDQPATCACLRGFVAEHFSARELDGALLVLADPAAGGDLGAAFVTLERQGYELEEIMAVALRVLELGSTATEQCAASDAGADTSSAEPVAPAASLSDE